MKLNGAINPTEEVVSGGRMRMKTTIVAVGLILVLAGAVVSASSHRSWSRDRRAAILGKRSVSRGEGTPLQEQGIDKKIWDEDDEGKFRLAVTVYANKNKENGFVDKLVNEWKLAKQQDRGELAATDIHHHVSVAPCSIGFGGNGGRAFFFVTHTALRVTRVCGRRGALLDQIQPVFANGWGIRAGGHGGHHFCWQAPSGCINRINLRTGSLVDGIQFRDSHGHHSGWYGGHGGQYHVVTSSRCLIAIFGRSAALVDKIGFCFGP